MRIGFIGLGSMGAPIARRLARSGYDVTGCDVVPAALDAFDEPGVRCVADPVEAARGADILGICVRTDAQVESLLADNKIYEGLADGGLIILNSTVAPALARKLAEDAKAFGIAFIDVGVSGGGGHALEGKLSLFVGGEEQAVEQGRPFLEAIGIVAYLGPVGRGLEGKLINNVLSIANMGLAALAIELGESLHFDRVQLRDALLLGSADSFALRAIPGLLDWKGEKTAAAEESLHALLEKDITHGAKLAAEDDPNMATMVRAAHALLANLKRNAAAKQ